MTSPTATTGVAVAVAAPAMAKPEAPASLSVPPAKTLSSSPSPPCQDGEAPPPVALSSASGVGGDVSAAIGLVPANKGDEGREEFTEGEGAPSGQGKLCMSLYCYIAWLAMDLVEGGGVRRGGRHGLCDVVSVEDIMPLSLYLSVCLSACLSALPLFLLPLPPSVPLFTPFVVFYLFLALSCFVFFSARAMLARCRCPPPCPLSSLYTVPHLKLSPSLHAIKCFSARLT